MRTSINLISLVVGGALVAASCGGPSADGAASTTSVPAADTPPGVTLDGTSWVVTKGSLAGAVFFPVPGRQATLVVDGNGVTGSSGCNTYHGSLSSTPDGGIVLTRFQVTEMGCEPDVMAFEQAMLAVLLEVDRFAWDGDELTMRNADDSAVIMLTAAGAVADVALDAVQWQLTGIVRDRAVTSIAAGTNPFLVVDLAAGAVRGNGGCNDFGARVSFDGDRITVSELISTEVACDQLIMDQEADYFRILAQASTWHLEGTTLTISGDGDAVTFTAETADQS